MMRNKHGLPRWPAKVVDKSGVQVDPPRKNGNIVVHGRLNGRSFVWVVGKTPSDRRANRNAIRELKKQLRQCGMTQMPNFPISRASSAFTGDHTSTY